MVIHAPQNQAFYRSNYLANSPNRLKQAAVQKGRRRGRKSLDLLRQLRRLLLIRRLIPENQIAGGDGSDYVFTSQKGGRMHRSQFLPNFSRLRRIGRSASGEVAPHVLKHSLATHLIAGNVNLAVVKQALAGLNKTP
jgi:site-specific recombinase XerC